MFEVSACDIGELSDSQLRELTARLCALELLGASLPSSAVTAGGDQRAADGGIDVRVTLDHPVNGLNYIPRPQTGFQVKQERAFGPAKVAAEMTPGGQARPVLQELADRHGAYVIVSGREALADPALKSRLAAMRCVADGLRDGARLQLDFYDGKRIADWVNMYPGMVLWVLDRLGRASFGYRPYGNWTGVDAPFFADDAGRVLDRTGGDAEPCALVPGIERLRDALRQAGACVRLVGLSGTGKTRLVQALFEDAVGSGALAPELAVYVDTGDEPNPPVREVLARLVAGSQRTILVVDNCAPEMHRSLAKELQRAASSISLLTVEYDIRADEPEETRVFRLLKGSNDLIDALLQQHAPQLSLMDRSRLVDWSLGNARLALALARRVGSGESLSHLTDQQLFERLLHQRHGQSDELRRAGEVAALAYSFNLEAAGGEAAEWPLLAALAEQTPGTFRRHIEELRRRDLVQRRGRWRAVMPPALAHHLAKAALENLATEDLALLFRDAPPRLLKSFARQLGHLHDSERARRIVRSWFAPGGLLGEYGRLSDDERAMFRFVSAVEPETTLAAIERSLDELLSTRKAHFDDPLSELARLLRWLAHDPALFARVVEQLVRILVERNDDPSIAEQFSELFWLTLSGTRAGPEKRLAVVDKLQSAQDERLQRLALVALEAMLKTSHFMSLNLGTIGARPWDAGWRPTNHQQLVDWYASVLARLERLILTGGILASEARTVLAKRFAHLWRRGFVIDDLERAMRIARREGFWPEGYIAVCKTLARRAKEDAALPDLRLAQLRDEMQPADIVEEVHVFVLQQDHGPFDWAQIEATANGDLGSYRAADRRAFELGQMLADDDAAFAMLLPDLLRSSSRGVWPLGGGLAQASVDPAATWRDIVAGMNRMRVGDRRQSLAMGFLVELQERDSSLVGLLLDAAVRDATLGPHFVYLQTAVPLDKEGTQRLRVSLKEGLAPLASFEQLAFGRSTDTIDADDLAGLIEAIACRPDGFFIATHILSMRLFSDREPAQTPADKPLLACGRALLATLPVDSDDLRLRYIEVVAKACLQGPEAEEHARALCRHLLESDGKTVRNWHKYERLICAIFSAQPLVALDEFTDPSLLEENGRLWFGLESGLGRAIDQVPETDLLNWMSRDPTNCSLRLARMVSLLRPVMKDDQHSLSPAAVTLIRNAPDRGAVLRILRAFPSSYLFGGSAAAFYESCRALVHELHDPDDAALSFWLLEVDQRLASSADHWRSDVRESEERFED